MEYLEQTKFINEKYKWEIQSLHTNVAIDHITKGAHQNKTKKEEEDGKSTQKKQDDLAQWAQYVHIHARLLKKQYSSSGNTKRKVQQVSLIKII